MSSQPEPKYPPAVIRRYRELIATNGFDREITQQEPVNLKEDRLTLACGHSTLTSYTALALSAGIQQLKTSMVIGPPSEAKAHLPKTRCEECICEWLAEALRRGGGE